MCDYGQAVSQTDQQSDRPPPHPHPHCGSPSSSLRRRAGRYGTGFAPHGWYHEPYSPVKNAMCVKGGTHPKIYLI